MEASQDQQPEASQATPNAVGPMEHKKKKREYASQAYELGSGANAAGTPPADPYWGGGHGQPHQQQQHQQQHMQAHLQNPQMQPESHAMAGMAAPVEGYPHNFDRTAEYGQPSYAAIALQPQDTAAGIAGLTGGIAGLDMGGGIAQAAPQQQQQHQQQQPQLQYPGHQQHTYAGQQQYALQHQQQLQQMSPGVTDLSRITFNQLHTSDLLQQPLNAAEVQMDPPPIPLPSSAGVTSAPTANCSPKYIRSTLNAVPTTHSLLKKSKLPFALVIQPYGSLRDDEDQVPLVEDQVISRCRRCRSYINPFVAFLDHGHRWRCNMCGLSNDVPQAFDWDASQQKHVDRWQRAELNHAIVEFVAPQEYMVRPPQPLVYLFLLDVSYGAVSSGLLATAARTISDSLSRIPDTDRRTRLGFLAFDTSLYYFSVPRDTDERGDVDMLVVGDLDEAFLPVPNDLLVPLNECGAKLERFLGRLPDMFRNNQGNGSCLGSALRAGYKLISPLGGKMTVLSASLPNVGHARLEMREDKKLLGTAKEGGLLGTGHSFYKSFAVECSKSQVSVDMFLFSSQYQDVASLSNLPRYTGGQTFFYPAWNAGRAEDAVKLAAELSDYLSAEIGLEAVLRVRATTGLRMSSYYGNFFNRSSDLCAFPAFPRDQAYVVEVAIDENLARGFVCMQTAVLHTTCNGERRIRVMTLALPTTAGLADVYASADAGAIVTYHAHKAVEKALGGSLDGARDMLMSRLAEVVVAFRKELAGGNMSGGLQLPYNLRALPALFLGLSKHTGLRRSSLVPSDVRSAALCLLSTLPVPLLLPYVYPRLYSLHDMPDNAGLPDPNTGQVMMPPPLNLASDRLASYGLYLLDDGQNQFMWVGRDAVPQLLADVFGVQDRGQVRIGKGAVPELENDFNERVRAVAAESRHHLSKGVGSLVLPPLFVVREDGEPQLRLWAQSLLIEDSTDPATMSYQQWLGNLREKCI